MNPKNFSIIMLLALLLLVPVKAVLAEGDSEETRQIVLALFEAFNRHDTEALVALYTEDTKIVSPGDKEPRFGHEVVREIYQGHFDNIPGVYDAVQNIIAEGNRAAVEFIASWDQPTEDDPEARGTLRISTFITITDGLISADVTYYDRVELTENMDLGDEK
jgi:ketosteroid isomerase-like protein